jgi:hypothetical protein
VGVRLTGRHAASGLIDGRGPVLSRLFTGWTIQVLLVAAISGGLVWLVWIYGNSLRDPRYLDGWILAGGMGLQLGFHIAIKTAFLSPKSIKRWQKFHVFLGYVLIASFVSHCDFSLPDSGLEWALWTAFVLVTLSGIFGIYLAWSLRARHGLDAPTVYDVPTRRAELARNMQAVVTQPDQSTSAIPLPPLPDDAWIADLYTNRLRDFFHRQRNLKAHLIGSRRPLKLLTDEIDTLARYAGKQNQSKLAAIKDLVVEKDRLDFAAVHFALTKGWLFIHVPVTYALIVLTVLHVLVVYAFSSGDW